MKKILSLVLAIAMVLPLGLCWFTRESFAEKQKFIWELHLFSAPTKEDNMSLFSHLDNDVLGRVISFYNDNDKPVNLNEGCGDDANVIYMARREVSNIHAAVKDIKVMEDPGQNTWVDPKTGACYEKVTGITLTKDYTYEMFNDFLASEYKTRRGYSKYEDYEKPVDINGGVAGAKPLYIFITYDGIAGDPITSLEFCHSRESGEFYAVDENGETADLNKGTGGTPLYISFSRTPTGEMEWYEILWYTRAFWYSSSYDYQYNLQYVPDEMPQYGYSEDVLVGWYYDKAFTRQAHPGDKLYDKTILYPRFRKTVTFDYCDGTAPLTYSILDGEAIPYPDNFHSPSCSSIEDAEGYPNWPMHRDGRIFLGWSYNDGPDFISYKAEWACEYEWFLERAGEFVSTWGVHDGYYGEDDYLELYNDIMKTGRDVYAKDITLSSVLMSCRILLGQYGYEMVDGELVKLSDEFRQICYKDSKYVSVTTAFVQELIDKAPENEIVTGLYSYFKNDYTPQNPGDAGRDELLAIAEAAMKERGLPVEKPALEGSVFGESSWIIFTAIGLVVGLAAGLLIGKKKRSNG